MEHIIDAIAVGLVGLVGFLLTSFFSRPREDFVELKSSVDKLSGRLDVLTESVHRETTETAVMKQELRAVWRSIDGAHNRASDGED